jgi:hypothetical protein
MGPKVGWAKAPLAPWLPGPCRTVVGLDPHCCDSVWNVLVKFFQTFFLNFIKLNVIASVVMAYPCEMILISLGSKKYVYQNKQWHESCFKCVECSRLIGGNLFIPHNSQPVCTTCYENTYALKCEKCKFVSTAREFVLVISVSTLGRPCIIMCPCLLARLIAVFCCC